MKVIDNIMMDLNESQFETELRKRFSANAES